MNEACERAGHPERAFECVHVAGTNGKGSVCAMVESVARAAGKKTGLYTSPHLMKLAERIRVNGEPLADDALEEVLARALAIGPELSFFETVDPGGVPRVSRREGGSRGHRGRDRREARRDERDPPAARGGDHADRVRPHGQAGRHARGDRAGEGGDREAGGDGRARRGGRGGASRDRRGRARTVGARLVDAADARPASTAVLLRRSTGVHQAGNRDVAVGRRVASSASTTRRSRAGSARRAGPGGSSGSTGPTGRICSTARTTRTGRARSPSTSAPNPASRGRSCSARSPTRRGPRCSISSPPSRRTAYTSSPAGAPQPLRRAGGDGTPGGRRASVSEALQCARALAGAGGLVVVCGSLYLVGEARALLLGLESDPPVAM